MGYGNESCMQVLFIGWMTIFVSTILGIGGYLYSSGPGPTELPEPLKIAVLVELAAGVVLAIIALLLEWHKKRHPKG